MHKLYPNFIIQKDGGRYYTSVYTLSYICLHVPELLEPKFWKPHSPNLNPLHYCLWAYLRTVTYNHQIISNFDQLKKEIVKAWKTIP